MIITKVERVRESDDVFYALIADTEQEIVGVRKFHSLSSAHQFAHACLLEDDEVCEECGGTGEVDCMESVYYGEPHQALIGTRKCVCQFNNEE